MYCNTKNTKIIENNIMLLSVITPQATKQLANAVPNILLILIKLLYLPLCSVSTYLLDSASVDGLESPINPIANINITIFLYKFVPSNIIYAQTILKILDINIHFAIPNFEDIVTNNGVTNPVIPNLSPYTNSISHIGIPLLYNITVPNVPIKAFAKLYDIVLKYIYLYSFL